MRLRSFALAGLLAVAAAPMARAADLKITILGATGPGQVFARLFATPENFDRRDPAVASLMLTPTGGQVSVTISGLPAGRYAVAAFQDAKGTGRLESNVLGVPTEPYGFSNDATGLMGPPGFDRAAVTLGAESAAISFSLR